MSAGSRARAAHDHLGRGRGYRAAAARDVPRRGARCYLPTLFHVAAGARPGGVYVRGVAWTSGSTNEEDGGKHTREEVAEIHHGCQGNANSPSRRSRLNQTELRQAAAALRRPISGEEIHLALMSLGPQLLDPDRGTSQEVNLLQQYAAENDELLDMFSNVTWIFSKEAHVERMDRWRKMESELAEYARRLTSQSFDSAGLSSEQVSPADEAARNSFCLTPRSSGSDAESGEEQALPKDDMVALAVDSMPLSEGSVSMPLMMSDLAQARQERARALEELELAQKLMMDVQAERARVDEERRQATVEREKAESAWKQARAAFEKLEKHLGRPAEALKNAYRPGSAALRSLMSASLSSEDEASSRPGTGNKRRNLFTPPGSRPSTSALTSPEHSRPGTAIAGEFARSMAGGHTGGRRRRPLHSNNSPGLSEAATINSGSPGSRPGTGTAVTTAAPPATFAAWNATVLEPPPVPPLIPTGESPEKTQAVMLPPGSLSRQSTPGKRYPVSTPPSGQPARLFDQLPGALESRDTSPERTSLT
eukprot:TRINITY_DN23857_c0_g1_i1.p1 TRINITY_DN23857_c0_g1~~TRINITY_DN23857_c0_g1_i1.p1  ORF type:complete len:537 (+),score=83.39 TRINITY_DN23857_c0_g1_i1:918-2528(+)